MKKFSSVNIFCACLLAVSSASAAPVSLTNWTVQQYSTGGTVDSEWTLLAGDTSASQNKKSANASILLSDFTIDHSTTQGFTTSVTIDDDDDDQIGMAFGYQDLNNFYLFQWKSADDPIADRGMHLRRITSAGPEPSQLDLEGGLPTGTGTGSLFMLAQNDLIWSPNVDYEFTVTFTPAGFDFDVSDGNGILDSWSINDLTFIAGKVGFYNSSQRNAVYSGSVVIPLPGVFGLFFSALLGLLPFARKSRQA